MFKERNAETPVELDLSFIRLTTFSPLYCSSVVVQCGLMPYTGGTTAAQDNILSFFVCKNHTSKTTGATCKTTAETPGRQWGPAGQISKLNDPACHPAYNLQPPYQDPQDWFVLMSICYLTTPPCSLPPPQKNSRSGPIWRCKIAFHCVMLCTGFSFYAF